MTIARTSEVSQRDCQECPPPTGHTSASQIEQRGSARRKVVSGQSHTNRRRSKFPHSNISDARDLEGNVAERCPCLVSISSLLQAFFDANVVDCDVRMTEGEMKQQMKKLSCFFSSSKTGVAKRGRMADGEWDAGSQMLPY